MSFFSFALSALFFLGSSGYFLYHGVYGLRGLERYKELQQREKKYQKECYDLFLERETLLKRIESFQEPFVHKDILELYSWTLFRIVPKNIHVLLFSP